MENKKSQECTLMTTRGQIHEVHEVSNKNGKILDVKDCALDRILA